MCQCVVCDCWWINCCGIVCGGCFHGCCLASCWCCMPPQMYDIDADCCKVGCCSGWGYNHGFHGSVICISDSMRQFSDLKRDQDAIMTDSAQGLNQW